MTDQKKKQPRTLLEHALIFRQYKEDDDKIKEFEKKYNYKVDHDFIVISKLLEYADLVEKTRCLGSFEKLELIKYVTSKF